MWSDVVLSLGSNMGDRLATLQGAVDALAQHPDVEIAAVSSVFETDPVGGPEQDDYLNAIAIGRTRLLPRDLLDVTQAIEHAWNRMRDIRWGPRTLDIDIIELGGLESQDPDLVLPHPRAHERAFVLVPWLEADPDADLVGYGSIRALLSSMDASGVRPTRQMLTLPLVDSP